MASHLLTRHIRICNEDGLQMRAAMLISQCATRFDSDVQIRCGPRHANAKNLWELLGLIGDPGCELVLQADGCQSEEALDEIENLISHRFQVLANEKKEKA
jgi:phosphocarrier protein HPr